MIVTSSSPPGKRFTSAGSRGRPLSGFADHVDHELIDHLARVADPITPGDGLAGFDFVCLGHNCCRHAHSSRNVKLVPPDVQHSRAAQKCRLSRTSL